MSSQAVHLSRPAEAVRLAQLGAAHGPCNGPVAALLATREARAWARLGARAQATAATRRAFDTHAAGSAAAPQWARFFGEGEVIGQAGLNARDLGEWTEAEDLTARAAGDTTMPLRARALYALDLVEMVAGRGDTVGAASVVVELLPRLDQMSSARVSAQAQALVGRVPGLA
jgi:hypothetical protein